MTRRHWLALAWALALGVGGAWGGRADAGFRQYYSSWHRSPYHYHYRYFYYTPSAYDYVISYPAQRRYLYYYNPVSRTYWGRFDLKTKGYSLLAEADRKGALKDIPEDKFPAPTDLPTVHGDKGADKVEVPPDDLPVGEDLGTKNDTIADSGTDQGTKPDKTGGDAGPAPKPQPTPTPISDGTADGGTTPTLKPGPAGDGDGTATPTPTPAPKPGPADGGTPPAPTPKPGPADGGSAAPPAPKPAPDGLPNDAPPVRLAPGKGGCDKSCPNHK
jgi:hypothetical protein